MKNSGIFLTILVGLIICIAILFSAADRNSRQTEAENGLRNAIENAVENLSESKKDYTVANADEYIADFIEQLLLEVDSNSDISIEILEADYEKNLLSVAVTEEFTYINGKKGTITCEKTIIMDEPVQEETVFHTIAFYLTDEAGKEVIFKEYQVGAGTQFGLSLMEAPTTEGKTFDKWVDLSGQELNQSQLTVDQDYSFFAMWR